MPFIHICLLPDIQRPLLGKFYRAHQSPMRAKGDAQIWVAKEREIVGALCMSPVIGGQWLTGLFVAPDWRRQGISRQLIEAATAQIEGNVWLFCDPELLGFYKRFGFIQAHELPQPLTERLTRYRQTKTLIALALRPV